MYCLHPVPYGYFLFSFVEQNSVGLTVSGVGDIEGPVVGVVSDFSVIGVVSGSTEGSVIDESVVAEEQSNPRVQSPVAGLKKVENGQVIIVPFTFTASVLG